MSSLDVKEEDDREGNTIHVTVFFSSTERDEVSANGNQYCVPKDVSSEIRVGYNNVTLKGDLPKNKQKKNLDYKKNG